MKNDNSYFLGIMSGTSLDGLDMALCKFNEESNVFNYEIIHAYTFNYSQKWYNKLNDSPNLNAFDLILLHKEYGQYIGNKINIFLEKCEVKPKYIASHGHTIFHRPELGITFQLGDGAAIAAETGISVVSDFRNLDVCLGGQGAPLVPIGDNLLFNKYDYCLNIGGFANISFENDNKHIAFDICPANIVLNNYANLFNQEFDKGGELGRKGNIIKELVSALNNLDYYSKYYPKSLGREWVEKEFNSLLYRDKYSDKDILRSLYEHISERIASEILGEKKTVLVTGGGAYNNFLMELIREKSINIIIIPDNILIDFKEALIFAFLGYLNINDKVNCLKDITGASNDNIGGSIFKV